MLEKETEMEHRKRINQVFHYIEAHLDADLSLAILSGVAHFSPFHFHRIFKMMTGETLNEYVTRQRIEKLASDLIHKKTSITELSFQKGFDNNSSFTRTFKKFYGVSPTAFRKQNTNRLGRIRQLNSKNGQVDTALEKYFCMLNDHKNWIEMNAKIEIKEMAPLRLAYVSSIGPQHLAEAYQQLTQWATPRGLAEIGKFTTIYHDSFKMTAYDKIRLSACVILDKQVEISNEIGLTSIEGGKFIVGRFEIGWEDFTKSWTGLFIWMKENGYTKREGNPFEIYQNNFQEHPEKKSIVDFYLPVE